MRAKNAGMLVLAAFIWGMAFVAQSVGMDYIGPFAFNGIRFMIGALTLWVIHRLLRKRWHWHKELLKGGLACGAALGLASILQQIGLKYTTAGKAGFITAFYIILVPVLSVLAGHRLRLRLAGAILLAIFGLYLLCIRQGFAIARGDAFVFASAFLFSVHILIIDYFAPKVSGLQLSCLQFLISGLISLLPMLFLERDTTSWSALSAAAAPILYAGVLSCGVAYTLQIIGQRGMNPSISSLLMSLESCFSVLGGWLLLHERLSLREALGCLLMFAAIILAQLPEGRRWPLRKREFFGPELDK